VRLLVIGLLLFSGVLVLRLFSHQVVSWGLTVPVGEGHKGPPARGSIVDRNGLLLAADRFYYAVAVTANNLTTEEQRREVAQQLEQLVGLPANRTLALLTQYQDLPYLELAKAIPVAQGERILAFQDELFAKQDVFPLRFVFLTPSPKRHYPQRNLAGHLIGFVNLERNPFYGVESYYNRFLAEGTGVAFTDTPQKALDDLAPTLRRYLPSVAGKDLVLTIDSTVQWIIEEELKKGVEEYKAQRGTIIVQDPSSGEILGMASYPNYDPNRYGNAEYSQFLDPAISEQYEPGSVFKVITMGAGLDTGVITPTTVFNDPGVISVGGRPIFNSQLIGYGNVSAEDALALSLNVVTAQVALNVGTSPFYDYVRRFGFGSATEIDLAGEVPGALKTPGDPNWSESDQGTNSFGQGIAVTPLQMLNAVSSIANGGRLMRPYVVKARVSSGEVLETEPTVIHQTMHPDAARDLTGMMVTTVNKGNKAARVEGYEVAGKSGTAQIPTINGYLKDQVNASFVGFAPAYDPAVSIIVRLERPDQTVTLWASQNTAPIFARVMKRVLEHLNVPPDEVRNAIAGSQWPAAEEAFERPVEAPVAAPAEPGAYQPALGAP
jgi:cell division protein FtsI/penicillin-binding protein 2